MNTMILPPTRHQFNYLKLISNILKVHRVIPSVTVQYATNIDAIDAFTSDLILKHKAKLNGEASITLLQFNNSKNKNKCDMTDDELDSLISNLLSQNKDKYIEQIAIECMNSRRFINEATLKKLFRHYSLLGKPDMITILQKYCSKVDPNLYRRNAEFKHYLAKAQCFKGNSEKGLSILKDCYIHFENRRSMYRIILRELIQDSVLHRSEASLVIFKRYVKEFSDTWGDHYPLVCLWHICWTSSWFSDQVLADELLEYSGNLRDIVKDKATEFSITVLKDYNEDAVVRLLQSLLKYVMIDEYAKVLQVLFTYKLKHRDIRGCAEIIRNCEVLGISIPSDLQGQYIKMLITGEVDDKPVKSIRPSLKNFKLKF